MPYRRRPISVNFPGPGASGLLARYGSTALDPPIVVLLTEPTPEQWASQEDHDGEQDPTRFECFWIPLEAAHILQSGQGALLGRLCD
jgi:hypothetical protein